MKDGFYPMLQLQTSQEKEWIKVILPENIIELFIEPRKMKCLSFLVIKNEKNNILTSQFVNITFILNLIKIKKMILKAPKSETNKPEE